MGRKTDREAACYTNHHLTSQRLTPQEQGPYIAPEPESAEFEILQLPVRWAVREHTDVRFIPVCTWCDIKRHWFDKDGTLKEGNFLLPVYVCRELAENILLLHLTRKHRKPDVVSPFEPYGLIFEQIREPVWRE
jgi:hypothetical protein